MAQRKAIATNRAPAAIGPYSQGIVAGGFLFVSGQIPLDPETGKMVEGGIQEQTERVLANLREILQSAGAGMESVVRTTVYLTDLAEFAGMNQVYAKHFPGAPPARSTLQVAALPRGAQVEIDAIARVGERE
jgi:2-iminobutanoate/2-iminopropanoate deaminase